MRESLPKLFESFSSRLNLVSHTPRQDRGFFDGKIGEDYIKNYIRESAPVYEKYLKEKIRDAKQLGSLPAQLLTDFSEIAQKGKRVRGALVVLGYEAAGGLDHQEILEASLSIELIHSGLLVHDDIQDNDDIRRGVPTIHKRFEAKGYAKGLGQISKHYGISMAINAGISAYFLGMDKLMYSDFPSDRVVQAGRITTDYVNRVAHGQALDVSNLFVNNINQDELLNILKYKSAEYTGVLPLLVGATLAGEKRAKYLSYLVQYGLSLGWAFQIQDDLLGTFGEEAKLGKSVGIDLKEGKVTLLVLHLAKHGNKKQRDRLKQIFGNKHLKNSDVEDFKKMLKDVGSYDYVLNMGWDYVKKAEKYIPKITDDPKLSEIFRSLLYFMMQRAV